MKEEIEIKPTGSFFEVDVDGFLVNPATIEKIQPEWQPVMDAVIATYKEHCGEDLVAVYVRGSVAKGQAVAGVSDIDTFAVVRTEKEDRDDGWIANAEVQLGTQYSFVNGVELWVRKLSSAEQDAVLLNQSVCVYGSALEVPKLRPGRALAIHVPHLQSRIDKAEEFALRTDMMEERAKRVCEWLMKGWIRVGMELVIERSGKYTRDLYPCYKAFSEYYPDREADMREALYYALNPTSDMQVLKRITDSLGQFLLGETKKVDWQA